MSFFSDDKEIVRKMLSKEVYKVVITQPSNTEDSVDKIIISEGSGL